MNRQDNYNAFVATREALTTAAIEAANNAKRDEQQPSLNTLVSFLRDGLNRDAYTDTPTSARDRLEAIKKEIAAAQAFLGDIDAALDTQITAL